MAEIPVSTLVYEFVGKDVGAADHFDALAECLDEISVALRKCSQKFRAIRSSDAT